MFDYYEYDTFAQDREVDGAIKQGCFQDGEYRRPTVAKIKIIDYQM